MTYLTNRLNDYETYTYNIKLYMVNPSNLSKLDGAIASGQSTLIADNASFADYNISDVEQIFTVGHNKVREAMGNKFTMTIQEPNGVTLLNTLKLRSNEIGVHSHLHAGYILVIEFNGRKSNNIPHKFEQVFFYPLTIRSIDFKVTDGGTTYNVDFVENSSNGYGYLSNVIKEQITIVAQTVGEFVEKFQKAANESALRVWELDIGSIYPDTYEFIFDETTESWKDWRFQVLDAGVNANGVNIISSGEDGDPSLQITINNGSNISAIFGQVLQLTAEYKKILVSQSGGERTFRSEPSSDVDLTTPLQYFPVFFKAISNIEYNRYDVLKGSYEKKIIFKLKAYTVTTEIISPSAYINGITNGSIQNTRVGNLISQNFLRKKYEYYYTGNNTEIIDFDMKFDFAYYYVTARGAGMLGDPDVQTPQTTGDVIEIIARLANRKRQVSQATQSLNQAIASGSNRGTINTLTGIVGRVTSTFNSSVQTDIALLRERGLSESDINYALRFSPDVINDQDMATSDNDRLGGNLQFGAVKTNLENASDLITIELGIRGDPYWMGRPNSLLNQQRSEDDVVDYEAGSVNFFLHVNLPTPNEDRNGQRKPDPDYQMSGVYAVRNVINRFQGGVFTQYLSAVRDLGTNTSTAWSRLVGDQSVITGIDQARTRSQPTDIAQALEIAQRRVNGTGN